MRWLPHSQRSFDGIFKETWSVLDKSCGWIGTLYFLKWFTVYIVHLFLWLFFSLDSKDQENNVEGWIVSSESCSFQAMGAQYYREVQPGEIIQITKQGIKTLATVPRKKQQPPAFCIFEYVYFARPDSILEGISNVLFCLDSIQKLISKGTIWSTVVV